MLKKSIACVLCAFLLFQAAALTVFAKNENLEFYFYPLPMTDDGVVEIQIRMRNIERAVPRTLGGVSGITMDIAVDTTAVDIVGGDNLFTIVDGMLITSPANLMSMLQDPSAIRLMFVDMTLEKGLITRDGVLCSFRVKAREKRSFYNSNDTYAVSFKSLSATTYSTETYKITALDNVIGWDNRFGGNMPAQWLPPLKTPFYNTMEFTIGENAVVRDGEKIILDCAAYIDEETGTVMLPLRAALEGAGFGVNWNGRTNQVSGAWAGKMFTAKVGDAQIVLNGGEATLAVKLTNKDGRTYMPLEFLAEFTGYGHIFDGEKITLSIA